MGTGGCELVTVDHLDVFRFSLDSDIWGRFASTKRTAHKYFTNDDWHA